VDRSTYSEKYESGLPLSGQHEEDDDFLLAQYSPKREILWADSPSTRSRAFAVSHLYPRLLYTFSDTIVYVLKNARYEFLQSAEGSLTLISLLGPLKECLSA
jgi:hypothetical protein